MNPYVEGTGDTGANPPHVQTSLQAILVKTVIQHIKTDVFDESLQLDFCIQ